MSAMDNFIDSWYDDPSDTRLLDLLPLLRRLQEMDDVRPLLRDTFRLRDKIDQALPLHSQQLQEDDDIQQHPDNDG